VAEEQGWVDAINRGAAFNDPTAAMKMLERIQRVTAAQVEGRAPEPQTVSGVPSEAEVMASIEAARAACVDCPK